VYSPAAADGGGRQQLNQPVLVFGDDLAPHIQRILDVLERCVRDGIARSAYGDVWRGPWSGLQRIHRPVPEQVHGRLASYVLLAVP
jgi:hypothetical protein